MALVDRVGTLGRIALPLSGRPPGAGPGFVVPADPAGAAPNAPAGIASTSALSGMLGLQEAMPDAAGDDHAKRHASTLLAELAVLQRALLGGGDPAAALGRLEALVSTAPSAASPALLAVLMAVRLRARVELARRAVMPAP